MKRTDSGLIAASFRTLNDLVVYRPRTLADAVRIVAASETPPVLLAGGTDLVAKFNEGLSPQSVLALGGIADLRTIVIRGDELHLGALVTHAQGSTESTVRSAIPGFAAAWSRLASVRVRYKATLGGNLMAGRRSYEMPMLLAAFGGRVNLASGKRVEAIAADRFAQTSPTSRAIVTSAVIPLSGLLSFGYDRSLRPAMTLALCLRRTNGALHGRAVIGTETMPPFVLDFGFERDDSSQIAAGARETAERAFARFPAEFCDLSTSNAYLRTVGTTLLARLLTSVSHGTN